MGKICANIILARAHKNILLENKEVYMDTIKELQAFRTQLIQEINVYFDHMIQNLRMEENVATTITPAREYEIMYPLSGATGIFKGKRPIGVCFPDGSRVEVPTWKKVVEEILKRCNKLPEKHIEMQKLCGKILGRDRVLLASTPYGMRSPIEIDRNIYMESHYDTESLLRIMVTRILDPIQYDYSGIMIVIRND